LAFQGDSVGLYFLPDEVRALTERGSPLDPHSASAE